MLHMQRLLLSVPRLSGASICRVSRLPGLSRSDGVTVILEGGQVGALRDPGRVYVPRK